MISCDPKEMAKEAVCFETCIPTGLQGAVQTYLLCQIANLVGGGLKSGVPSGVILLWSGTVASIPTGWTLCDGNNGTPDLRDRFVVGSRQDDSGVSKTNLTGVLTQIGGSIIHNHTITDPGHFHVYAGVTTASPGVDPVASAAPSDHVSTMPTGITINSQSSPQPYYSLAYIMKI